MPMHTRHPSNPYSPAPSDKHQTSTSGSSMLCSYPSSTIYTSTGSGVSGSGDWGISQRQSYGSVDPQRGRHWPHHESSLRRERRVDCPGVSPVQNAMHSHHASHPEGSHSPYSHPTNIIRAPGPYDTIFNSRPVSTEVTQSPMPNWNTWDVDASSAASSPHQYHRYSGDQTSWNSDLNIDIAHLGSPEYDSMLMSSSGSSSSSVLFTPNDPGIPLNGFQFPHRISPDAPSPSPSPVYHEEKRRSSGSTAPPPSSRRGGDSRGEAGKEPVKSCSHCRATTTPLWRRDPSTMKPLCNACGLYLQQRNKLRPQELIDADDDGSSEEEVDPNYVGPKCSHCDTHHTSVWRRSKEGEQLCNACGVYLRLRGKPRPLTLKKHKIRPRSKHSPK